MKKLEPITDAIGHPCGYDYIKINEIRLYMNRERRLLSIDTCSVVWKEVDKINYRLRQDDLKIIGKVQEIMKTECYAKYISEENLIKWCNMIEHYIAEHDSELVFHDWEVTYALD